MADGLEFDWDQGNIRHIARHAVLPEEAEQAIGNDPLDFGSSDGDGKQRFVSLGVTNGGPVAGRGNNDARREGQGSDSVRGGTKAGHALREGERSLNMPEMERIAIPVFPSEAEEAAWWDSHRDLIEERFLQAAAAGTLGHGRVAKQAAAGKRPGASPTLTLRVPETDISRARALAARKGLRYQTYLRMLIHEGLEREEQRAG